MSKTPLLPRLLISEMVKEMEVLKKVQELLNAPTFEVCGEEFLNKSEEEFKKWFEENTGIKALEVGRCESDNFESSINTDGFAVKVSDGEYLPLWFYFDFKKGRFLTYGSIDNADKISDELFAVITVFTTLMDDTGETCKYLPLSTINRIVMPAKETIELYKKEAKFVRNTVKIFKEIASLKGLKGFYPKFWVGGSGLRLKGIAPYWDWRYYPMFWFVGSHLYLNPLRALKLAIENPERINRCIEQSTC